MAFNTNEEFWSALLRVPFNCNVNKQPYLAEDWDVFVAGTTRTEIWSEFEKIFDVPIARMIFSWTSSAPKTEYTHEELIFAKVRF